MSSCRASLSRTMTRPNPNAMLPGAQLLAARRPTPARVGNPALDPFISDQIDLGIEYYTGGEGLIAVAAFRKSITGFTVNGNVTVPFSDLAAYGVTFDTLTPTQQAAINSRGGPNAATVVLTQQVNADGKLKVNGLEFQLGAAARLPDRVDSASTASASRATDDHRPEGRRRRRPAIALGVAPTTYNVAGYYENTASSARLIYTYNEGSQIVGRQPERHHRTPRCSATTTSSSDFSGSLDLAEMFDNAYLPTLTFDVINITKSTQRTYFQYPNAAFTYYEPGRTVMIGLRGSF